MRPMTRARLNRLNGTTLLGAALARAAGCRRSSGPLGTSVAARYHWPIPNATCFVIGDVIFCRRTAEWLHEPTQQRMLAHELRHTTQYAWLGPTFLPLYFASCGWSYLLTGDRAARNPLERQANLADGGYRPHPLRPFLQQLARTRSTGAKGNPHHATDPRTPVP